MRGYAAKRDTNERGIISALEVSGWRVFQLSQPGFPDLMCVRPHGDDARVVLLEVKEPRNAAGDPKPLTPKQREVFPLFAAAGLEPVVVTTPEQALSVAFAAPNHIEALAKAFADEVRSGPWDEPQRPRKAGGR